MVFLETNIEASGFAIIDGDQNGTKEIVLTLSNDQDGARLVLYDEAGKQLADGESLGQSHHWRHGLTVGAFLSEDQLELAESTPPHIGMEFC